MIAQNDSRQCISHAFYFLVYLLRTQIYRHLMLCYSHKEKIDRNKTTSNKEGFLIFLVTQETHKLPSLWAWHDMDAISDVTMRSILWYAFFLLPLCYFASGVVILLYCHCFDVWKTTLALSIQDFLFHTVSQTLISPGTFYILN